MRTVHSLALGVHLFTIELLPARSRTCFCNQSVVTPAMCYRLRETPRRSWRRASEREKKKANNSCDGGDFRLDAVGPLKWPGIPRGSWAVRWESQIYVWPHILVIFFPMSAWPLSLRQDSVQIDPFSKIKFIERRNFLCFTQPGKKVSISSN